MPPEVGTASGDRQRAYSELFGWVTGLLSCEQGRPADQEQQRRVQKLVSACRSLCPLAAAAASSIAGSPSAHIFWLPRRAAPVPCECRTSRQCIDRWWVLQRNSPLAN